PNGGTRPLDPLFFVAFDQKIDLQTVFAKMQVTADGQSVAVRLATEDEIAANKQVDQMVENGRSDQFIVFRAQQSLPKDAEILVTIPSGTPSAEGPRLTKDAQSFGFRTYAPLRITEHVCGWYYDEDCPPLTPFRISFNNPLDADAYTEDMLEIKPALPDAYVDISGNTLTIYGSSAGRTTYRVTVAGTMQDVYGQTLGQDETVRFKVGSAPQALSGLDRWLVTMDPAADPPIFTVYSINYDKLDVQIYAVDPEADWDQYTRYRQKFSSNEPLPPPGKRVMNETIRIDSEKDVLTETSIDLSEVLDGDTGHLLVIVQPPSGIFADEEEVRYRTIKSWVQVTQIGLDAFHDHSTMRVWTTNLLDGQPLNGVNITSESGFVQATTDSNGLAQFDLPPESHEMTLLIAKLGDDTAILRSNESRSEVWDEVRWFVFDDRQMYRPGEEVHVKGWMRLLGTKQDGDIGLVGGGVTAVSYTVIGSQGNELHTGTTEVSELGGFDIAFTLPDHVNLGYASLVLNANGTQPNWNGTRYHHSFQIQEFRRPEFEVKAQNETVGPYFVNEQATVSVSANYFAGGPLPNAEVTWNVSYAPSNYRPPNWSGFTFGQWIPWWWYDYYEPNNFIYESFTGVTDGAGDHYLQLDFEPLYEELDAQEQQEDTLPPILRPYSVSADATVMDTNRQAWSSSTYLLVHPSELYVGLRSERSFVKQGVPLDIEAIVTNVDGEAIAGREIEITAVNEIWKWQGGSRVLERVDVQECTITSAAEPVQCTFKTENGGRYEITAVVTDENGRPNESRFTRWVSGGTRPRSNRIERETVTLIPDKETYQPGDTAQILVQPPFTPAEALLTVERNGILYTEQFRIEQDSYTLNIPITDAHIPNLYVQVDLVGSAPRTGDGDEALTDIPPRPAYAFGRLKLVVPPLERTLELTVAPHDSALEPGSETAVDVTVVDTNGNPVSGAELAVVVVDEAVLALTNYQLSDPLSLFYSQRGPWVQGNYGRSNIFLLDPQSLQEQIQAEEVRKSIEMEGAVEEDMIMEMEAPAEEMAAAPMADESGAENSPIQVRSDFNPLATFAPTTYTDANGQATVAVKLPDNLTRYRVMVVAVAGDNQFGTGESNVTARLPLMVRPSAPRFLNFGDQFEFPVLLQNQTNEPMEVDVVLQTTNLELTANNGWRVTVPANNRVEVRFPAAAASAGTARYQIAAVSGPYADAALGELPVYTPATTEAFATYGVVDDEAVLQPMALPGDVIPQFGGLEITTSSTALQSLTDAVIYLYSYEYSCSEQLASRILAIAALRDVLSAFEAEGLPAPAELEAAVPKYIERLQGMQNWDGGFPVWERGKETVPFYSIHVAHALARAQEKGFDVPEDMVWRVNDYLINIESYYPSYYSQNTRWALSSYALYVRDLLGDSDPAKARSLYNEAGIDNLTLESLAWLWQVMGNDSAEASEIRQHINNRAVETAGAANFTTSYGDDAYLMLHSNRRTDGVILDALIANDPENDLIPKVVNGLMAHRTKGRWNNTQENVFILLALDRYFNTFEKETPDFVARVWLGADYVAEHQFEGRSTDSLRTTVPMGYLANALTEAGGTDDLVIGKDGNGRLYYRFGLNYAPADLNLDPLDMGFTVQRSYEAVEDPDDVWIDDDGIWHIKAGALVQVNITMIARNRRYHVALVDPLPAGLEIVNPTLAVSTTPPTPNEQPAEYSWWWGPWYEHQNMRDERAEAFSTLLWDGVYEYSYIARATTPGTFAVPPAKAEEMYSPEVFGRSGSNWVIVE
ncbi:MAG: hypothetical protein DWQ04_17950, partial [Chloroflexi bacterium]